MDSQVRRLFQQMNYLLVIFVTLNIIEVVSASNIKGNCTGVLLDKPNRDYEKPIFPLKEDLRLRPSNIVAAHEILRKGLQPYLELRDLDLGTYLNYILDKDPIFVDEYGKEIRSYYKVFTFIWKQYNESLCENYAIKQFEKDKLDLCSVARYYSHQPLFEGRQTIMKRMGDALGYRCHPCTPYKRKEYGDTVVPNTDNINPDGVSPEDSYTMCQGYSDHQGQSISSPITSTTTTRTTTDSTTMPPTIPFTTSFRPVTTITTTEPTTPFTITFRPVTTTSTTEPTTPFTTTSKPLTTTTTAQPTAPLTTITRSTSLRPTTTSESICLPEHHAICNNRKACVYRNQICNGVNDCGDNSDENGCDRITTPSASILSSTTTSAPSSGCQSDQFQCSNQHCIQKNWRCDGHNNCGDNSDEINGCKLPMSTTSSPILSPTANGKTWIPYDCKITQNGNSYVKICKNFEADQAQVEQFRRQLGPEMSPHSPIKTIPSGYNICSASSSTTTNGMTKIATLTESYCFQNTGPGFGFWLTGSSRQGRRIVPPAYY